MDKPNMNKRKTFSPSSIEQVEQDTYSRLCGTDNRYEVSEEWKGREPDLWEQLHSEFPAPSNIQAEVDVLKFYHNYRGCPDWCVTMDCICFNCTQMQDAYIPYAHQLMDESILANMPMPGRKAPRGSFDFVTPNDITAAVSMVSHLCHFYDSYCLCSHSNSLFECPETPIFTNVRLRDDLSRSNAVATLQNQELWIERMRMTPTRLVFKEETN